MWQRCAIQNGGYSRSSTLEQRLRYALLLLSFSFHCLILNVSKNVTRNLLLIDCQGNMCHNRKVYWILKKMVFLHIN